MPYAIVISATALRSLKSMERIDRDRVGRRIDLLAANPRPHGCLKLSGREEYRVRVGQYRIIYKIEDVVLVVTVLQVGHRRDVYE
jgi:mRNA interferase RelE/StbE